MNKGTPAKRQFPLLVCLAINPPRSNSSFFYPASLGIRSDFLTELYWFDRKDHAVSLADLMRSCIHLSTSRLLQATERLPRDMAGGNEPFFMKSYKAERDRPVLFNTSLRRIKRISFGVLYVISNLNHLVGFFKVRESSM